MKIAKELGLGVIKTENKEGTEALKNIHYRINDILYPTYGKYIDHAYAQYLYNTLCALGSELSELKVSDKALPKKKEILDKLRTQCKALKEVKDIKDSVEDVPCIQKSLNFFVANFIKLKNDDKLTVDNVLPLLKESKRLWDVAYPFGEHLKTAPFIKANSELLGVINSAFSIQE